MSNVPFMWVQIKVEQSTSVPDTNSQNSASTYSKKSVWPSKLMEFRKPNLGLDFLTLIWCLYAAVYLWCLPVVGTTLIRLLLACAVASSIGIWMNVRFSGYVFAVVNAVAAVLYGMLFTGFWRADPDPTLRAVITLVVTLYCTYAGVAWSRMTGDKPQVTLNERGKSKPSVRFSIREFMMVVAAIAFIFGGFISLGALGAYCAALIDGVLLIIYGKRSNRKWLTRFGVVISVPCFCIIALVVSVCLMFDIGPVFSASAHPLQFSRMIKIADADVSHSKLWSCGGFMRREYVWRVSLSREQLDLVTASLQLVPFTDDQVPEDFKSVFPSWWRPHHSEHSLYFATRHFPSQRPLLDGSYYFTMYDPQSQHFYVWYIFNW